MLTARTIDHTNTMTTPNAASRSALQQRVGSVAGGARQHGALPAAKTRFNKYLASIELPNIDDLQCDDINGPGDIITIMGGWGDHMKRNPPRHMNNPSKLLDPAGVGNAFGLIKEHLKSKFADHDDFKNEVWFTLQKADVLSSLGKSKIRGLDGDDEGTEKVGIVRCNPDADALDDADASASYYHDDEPHDLLTINRDLLRPTGERMSDVYERRLAINATYSADGRSGEIKYLNYQSFQYDPPGRCVGVSWKDIKNAKIRPVTFCTDYDRWETCVFDSFGDVWNASHNLTRDRNSRGKFGLPQMFVVPLCRARSSRCCCDERAGCIVPRQRAEHRGDVARGEKVGRCGNWLVVQC